MPADNLPDAANLAFLEELQGRYLDDPGSLPEHWRRYFESLPAEDRPAPGWRPAPSLGA